jgi:hypothetical protein
MSTNEVCRDNSQCVYFQQRQVCDHLSAPCPRIKLQTEQRLVLETRYSGKNFYLYFPLMLPYVRIRSAEYTLVNYLRAKLPLKVSRLNLKHSHHSRICIFHRHKKEVNIIFYKCSWSIFTPNFTCLGIVSGTVMKPKSIYYGRHFVKHNTNKCFPSTRKPLTTLVLLPPIS